MTAQANRDAFPLDSFKDAAEHLRRPFTAQAIKFKVQTTIGGKDNPTGGLIVSYIDARLAVERLNLIVPHLWADHYEPTQSGLMWCHLTVDGITRSDVGEGQGKGLVSDALKRAAVKFGIGVSLYAVPKMILNVSDGHLRVKRSGRDSLVLTPNGESRVRDLYAAWLDTHGKRAFGEPLDHGDVEGAQGDPEADDAPPIVASDGATQQPPTDASGNGASSNGDNPAEKPLTKEQLDELVASKNAAKLPDTPEAREWVRSQLRAVGVKDVPARVTLKVLKTLTSGQANELIDAFNQIVEAREQKAGTP